MRKEERIRRGRRMREKKKERKKEGAVCDMRGKSKAMRQTDKLKDKHIPISIHRDGFF